MMSPNRVKELCHKYLDNGIAAIPVDKVYVKDKGFTGKRSFVKGWSQFSERLPTEKEVDSWNYSKASGVAVVLGKASNLACIDIDRTEPEALLAMQPSSYVVVGGKGEKRFYRQRHDDTEPFPAISNTSPNNFEFFLTGRYAVVEGFHSQGENTDPLYYKTRGYPLIDADFDDIPVIDLKYIQVAQGFNTNPDKPLAPEIGEDGNLDGRFNAMKAEVAKVIAMRLSRDNAIQHCVDSGKKRNPNNLFFKDQKHFKGCTDEETNAELFIAQHRRTFASKKPHPNQIERPKTNTYSRLFQGKEWPEPSVFSIEAHVTDLDPKIIPNGKWKDMILHVSKTMGQDVAPAFIQSLAVASSLLGGRVTIFPKKYNHSFKIYPILWTLHTGRSGSKKSPLTGEFTGPLKEFQREAHQEYKEKFNKSMPLIKRLKKKITKLENKLNDAEDAEAETEMVEIQEEISAIQERMAKAEAHQRYYIIDHITAEAMYEIHEHNDCFLNVKDEFTSLWSTLKKKGYETFRGDLMTSHDGGFITYKTKHNGEQYIESARMSLIGNVQPSVLSNMFEEAQKEDVGFLQRAILTAETDSVKHSVDEKTPPRLKNFYDVKMNEANNCEHMTALFDEKAQPHYDHFEKTIDERYRKAETDFMGSFLGKFRGQAPKIAFLIEFIKAERGIPNKISLDSLERAIEILEYSYRSLTLQLNRPAYAIANELIEYLKLGLIEPGEPLSRLERTYSDFFRGHYARRSLKLLEKNNYIRLEKVGKGNYLRINPHLLGEKPDANKVKEMMHGN